MAADDVFARLFTYGATMFALSGLAFSARWALQRESKYRRRRISPAMVASVGLVGHVLLWYGLSTTFTLFNKFLYNHWRGSGWPFPVTASFIHMVLKYALSRVVLPRLGLPVDPLPWPTLLRWAVPIGVATGLDVMFSNMAIQVVSVSFYTILKASSLLFVLGFSVVLGLQRATPDLVAVVSLIACGLALASYGSLEFVGAGLVLLLLASACAGIRWSFTQGLLEAVPDLSALQVVYYIAPASAVALLPAALLLEAADLARSGIADAPLLAAEVLGFLLVGGAMAFALILVEVHVVQCTSSMTLAVTSHAKDVMQIGVAMVVFGDEVSSTNAAGFALALVGMLKYRSMRSAAAAAAAGGGAEAVEYKRVSTVELGEFSSAYSDSDSDEVPSISESG